MKEFDEDPLPIYRIGDRVEHADEDVGLSGTVIGVDAAGWLTIQWDPYFTHPDQVVPVRSET